MTYQDDYKDWEFVKVTADGVVTNGPTLVASLQVGAGAGIGSATLHNGQSVNAEDRMCLTAATNRCARNGYDRPIYFDKGIYLALAGNGEWARIQFKNIE